jgi:hypothetical protein
VNSVKELEEILDNGDDNTLLADDAIDGLFFYGSWTLYAKNEIEVENMRNLHYG